MTSTDQPIRVLLVDDQDLIRAGLAMILSVEDDIAVVAEAKTGRQAVDALRSRLVDVVLMDVQMPDMDGISATTQIVREVENPPKVIMLTTFDREDYLFDALRAGASGFLLKNSDPDGLVAAIRAVAGGHALLSPEVTSRVIARFAGQAPPPDNAAVDDLTERELEVLLLLSQGLSNAEIAARLFLGEATIKSHVSRLLAKLGLRDRVQAVVFAYEHGLAGPAAPTP